MDGSQAATDEAAAYRQQTAAMAARGTVDLAALAAPLLLQRSPAARNLYWKLVLAPAACACELSLAERQELQHLHSWLGLQLQCGRPAPTADSGTVYVYGPVSLDVPVTTGTNTLAAGELTVCVASPSGSSAGASAASSFLAGASGVVMAVAGDSAGGGSLSHWQLLLRSIRAPLPTLLVAGNEAAAQHWRQALSAGGLTFPGPVLVACVQRGAAAGSSSPGQASSSRGSISTPMRRVPASYSRQQLVHGLRWLAALAPSQPVLKVRAVPGMLVPPPGLSQGFLGRHVFNLDCILNVHRMKCQVLCNIVLSAVADCACRSAGTGCPCCHYSASPALAGCGCWRPQGSAAAVLSVTTGSGHCWTGSRVSRELHLQEIMQLL